MEGILHAQVLLRPPRKQALCSLGNPFVLHDPYDAEARNAVIERFRARYQADLGRDGPMAAATEALAELVRKGERIVCTCWCWPKPCHGNVIVDEIRRRLE